MVFRCYSEKTAGFDEEAKRLLAELKAGLGLTGITALRIINRYDAEGVDEQTFALACQNVFSEPNCDNLLGSLPNDGTVLAVEALPGQFDQRADSAAQCIQIITRGSRPIVKYARIYIFAGELSPAELESVKKYLINPVESREAALDMPETLNLAYEEPADVPTLSGFTALDPAGLTGFLADYGLAMDLDDLKFLQSYFKNEERRDPTLTEVRMIDTYWSDHCRHTTFLTSIDDITIEDECVAYAYSEYLKTRGEVYGQTAENRPVTLMDMATIAAKYLSKTGKLTGLDSSDEINACSVKINIKVDGQDEEWALMFKNETHNHPTEIEPFGGAATCLGGAIRDPLSGRTYVYQAMRVTGSGDPRTPLNETLPNKLPQRKITRTAAAGYSSYGNQIGLATGIVHEIYHPGYVAKRMEIGAVVGAAPYKNIRREEPKPDDAVILLGGRTGRDGCGGATGSSKSHSDKSVEECGAEVQKGNAPEERKLQRLFRNPEVTALIKRCNDFGAGGVSVAIGELADGLEINLDLVPKKYDGLDGTELAISESQERMAVVVEPKDVEKFIALALEENIEATHVATVKDEKRLKMSHRGRFIVDISRDFLNSNGAPKATPVTISDRHAPLFCDYICNSGGTPERLKRLAADLNICSQRGLGEMFDSTIGAASVIAPYGGKHQMSPAQVMAALLPVESGSTSDCSVMSFGYNADLSSWNPFAGAICAIMESAGKLIAAGCSREKIYLTLQEYFPSPKGDPKRWGLPAAALLGAFLAQKELGLAAIGGKDSMSGSFNEMDVPPTLVSFAIAHSDAKNLVTTDLKKPGSRVALFTVPYGVDGLPDFAEALRMWDEFASLVQNKKILSAWSLSKGGAAEAVLKMALGNRIGFKAVDGTDAHVLFCQNYGGIIAEIAEGCEAGVTIGRTTDDECITIDGAAVPLAELQELWEGTLEETFPTKAGDGGEVPAVECAARNIKAPAVKTIKPKAVITAFPGTNCELDTARALNAAGGEAEVVLIRNLSADLLEQSVQNFADKIAQANMLIIPGGFSGGDEPEGSAKFITAFFRNPVVSERVMELLNNRDGLILGICNGFQALIKLGLLPYGEIRELEKSDPTLTYNLIGRHQSRYVTTRVASVKSPWLRYCEPGQTHIIPISHGEGRFAADRDTIARLAANGQIAFQYSDAAGRPSMDILTNPNGSAFAIEGITSPDGRVLGKMGHSERNREFTGINIPGNKFQRLFEAGVDYFK